MIGPDQFRPRGCSTGATFIATDKPVTYICVRPGEWEARAKPPNHEAPAVLIAVAAIIALVTIREFLRKAS